MATKRKRTPKAIPLSEQLAAAQKKKEELEAAKADINSQLTACNADIERIRGLITLEELKGVGEKAKNEGITAADLSACIENPEVLAAIKKAIGKTTVTSENNEQPDETDTTSDAKENEQDNSSSAEMPNAQNSSYSGYNGNTYGYH